MNFIQVLTLEVRYFTNFQNKMYQFLLIFQPLMFLAIVYFLQEIRGMEHSSKFVITSGLISMWSYVLYSSGSSLVSQKWNDTLKLLIASPTSLFQILLSKTISNSLIASISLLLSFIYAKFIFRFKIDIVNSWLFFLSICVLLFALIVIGLILAVIFIFSQNVYDYQNLILTPIILVSGVIIPIENLPNFLQVLSYMLPLTWSISGVYQTLTHDPNVYNSLLIATFISILYLIVAFFIIRRIETVLQISGKMGELS